MKEVNLGNQYKALLYVNSNLIRWQGSCWHHRFRHICRRHWSILLAADYDAFIDSWILASRHPNLAPIFVDLITACWVSWCDLHPNICNQCGLTGFPPFPSHYYCNCRRPRSSIITPTILSILKEGYKWYCRRRIAISPNRCTRQPQQRSSSSCNRCAKVIGSHGDWMSNIVDIYRTSTLTLDQLQRGVMRW